MSEHLSENKKFILLHVSENEMKECMEDAISNGVERGLIFNNNLAGAIVNQFKYVKQHGYFPVGMIVDPINNTLEFLFNRHPNQTENMKLREFKEDKPIMP